MSARMRLRDHTPGADIWCWTARDSWHWNESDEMLRVERLDNYGDLIFDLTDDPDRWIVVLDEYGEVTIVQSIDYEETDET